MSAASLELAIQSVIKKGELIPKVIVPVDLFGQPADYDAICKIAQKYNLYILEDAAQRFGGNIRGKMACSFGDISCTSFSRQSLWDVMVMEVLYLRTMMNGQS